MEINQKIKSEECILLFHHSILSQRHQSISWLNVFFISFFIWSRNSRKINLTSRTCGLLSLNVLYLKIDIYGSWFFIVYFSRKINRIAAINKKMNLITEKELFQSVNSKQKIQRHRKPEYKFHWIVLFL